MSGRLDLSGMLMGLIFMALGGAFLLDRLGVWALDLDVLWPAVLIALGLVVLMRALFRRA